MKIKCIHAPDMQAALERVRGELGPDAVIHSTRPLGTTAEDRRRGLHGVEVIALIEDREAVSAVAEARAVAEGTARVAPGAVRAAYTLAMAGGGAKATTVAPEAPDTPRPPRAPGLPLSGIQAGVQTSTPSFPRLTRDGSDPDERDHLLPPRRAGVTARRRATEAQPTAIAPAETLRPPTAEEHALLDLIRSKHDELRAIPPSPPAVTSYVPADSGPTTTGPRLSTPAPPDPAGGSRPEPPLSLRPPVPDPAAQPQDAAGAPARFPAIEPGVAGPGMQPPGGSSAAHAAAETVFDLLRAAGIMERVAAGALEQAISVMPAAALCDADRLLEVALSRTIAGLTDAPELSAGSLAGRVLFFTGPAGVGKTTSLLKAALHLRRDGADVGIVGADVSRLGAAEQLQRYGGVLRLPVSVAYDAADLVQALAEAPDGRIILVDTPACGPGAEGLCEDVTALLDAAPGPVVVLTVAAGTGEGDLRRLAATPACQGATAVAITKLDEADGPGAALNVLACLRRPPLLCATGRDIISDLHTSTATELAVSVLEQLRGQA